MLCKISKFFEIYAFVHRIVNTSNPVPINLKNFYAEHLSLPPLSRFNGNILSPAGSAFGTIFKPY